MSNSITAIAIALFMLAFANQAYAGCHPRDGRCIAHMQHMQRMQQQMQQRQAFAAVGALVGAAMGGGQRYAQPQHHHHHYAPQRQGGDVCVIWQDGVVIKVLPGACAQEGTFSHMPRQQQQQPPAPQYRVKYY